MTIARGREEPNPMYTLRGILQDAQARGEAVGHFNISDLVLLKAVLGAARELSAPVVVGLSEGEREFVGTSQIGALVKSLREEVDFPIFLNADHTHSLAKGIEAAQAGFGAIVFGWWAWPLEETARETERDWDTHRA